MSISQEVLDHTLLAEFAYLELKKSGQSPFS